MYGAVESKIHACIGHASSHKVEKPLVSHRSTRVTIPVAIEICVCI